MTTRAYEPRTPLYLCLALTLGMIVIVFHAAAKAGGVW